MKYWRRITVDGVFYRWLVQDTQTRPGSDTFQRSILIHAEDHPNSRCSFISNESGHLWLWASAHSLNVRSRLVNACIRYALAHGWEPAQDGQDLRIELTAELLAQLNASGS